MSSHGVFTVCANGTTWQNMEFLLIAFVFSIANRRIQNRSANSSWLFQGELNKTRNKMWLKQSKTIQQNIKKQRWRLDEEVVHDTHHIYIYDTRQGTFQYWFVTRQGLHEFCNSVRFLIWINKLILQKCVKIDYCK